MNVDLGNPSCKGLDGAPTVTRFTIPDGTKAPEAARIITDHNGGWANHSTADAPTWVESDDPLLQALLADHYGIPAGRPDGEPSYADLCS